MKYISNATNLAHMEIIKGISPNQYERDVENIFNNFTSEKYYTRIWGYPCIAGCGTNGATLHYEDNNKVMKDGELFLGDMGMRFCNYVTDVTMTIPVNGKFSVRQKDIYNLVLKSNRQSMKMVKEGVKFMDIDMFSKKVILSGLQDLGLIKKEFSVDELYENRVWFYFYPHRLGHYVGIEVHDVYKVKYSQNDDILEAGNIITIEPGCYFRDFLLEEALAKPEIAKYLNETLIRSYYDFGGVRIEDDVLVLKDGFENLNEKLPREVSDIEAAMKK